MKYLLTFKPLKNFFFGSADTFSDDYFAISDYFPQNTQLLGALRLFIAEQKGLMKQHKNGRYSKRPEELKKLIGTAKSSDFMTNSDLGKINNLSGMFIVGSKLDDAFFKTPFDIEIADGGIRYYTLANFDDTYYFLKDYDSKKTSAQRLANSKFWSSYIDKQELSVADTIEYADAFCQHRQVGIKLEKKRVAADEDEGGAFYTKVDYTLKSDYLFACVIDFDDELDGGIIELGGDGSIFELKVQELSSTQLASHPIVSRIFEHPAQGDKVVCMSDTILESTNEFHSHFTIAPYSKPFRMLKDGDKNRSKFTGKTDQANLIPAGTVSFLDGQVVPQNSIGAFSKMGFAHYLTAKK
jgi:CRISPR type III-B/RAMP module-associated protein Cmr3